MNRTVITIVILSFLALAVLHPACEHIVERDALYGRWEGMQDSLMVVLTFNSDGTCEIEYRHDASGSTRSIRGDYEIDNTKKPIPLSITNIPQLAHPLHTIIEFVHDDSLRIARFAPRWRLRPIAFDRDTTINVKRTTASEL